MRTLPIWRFSVKPDSRFRRHEPPTAPVSITWQGETLTAEAGESLAAALLAAGPPHASCGELESSRS